MPDRLLKFLFQQAPVRGEVVRLSASWQQMTALHAYPEPVLRLLGETTAAATLLAAIIKFAGNLILQTDALGNYVMPGVAAGSYNMFANYPNFLNASVRSMASTTPVNARSSSAMSMRRRPIAGSLM